ncbi:MAG: DUF5302 domain-containing protein [Georgenia sp.]
MNDDDGGMNDTDETTGPGPDTGEGPPRTGASKEDLKAKMRAALDKKNAQHHAGTDGGGTLKGPHTANGGQQRRVFRRKSG